MTITLKPRQKDDLDFLRVHPFAGLWHEVGVGKTHPTIFRIFDLLDENPNKIALLVMKRSLFRAWSQKITESAAGYAKWEEYARNISIVTAGEQRFKNYSRIIMVNYDYFPKVWEAFMKMAEEGRFIVMVLDEVQRIKGFRGFRSKKGVRGKAINLVAAKIAHRYGLSGSPVLNPNSSDVWAIYHFLDNRVFGPTRWRFIEEFFYNLSKAHEYEQLVLKPGMREEMSRRMYLIARRLLKKDLPDSEFPELNRIPYYVEMPPKVRARYDELKDTAITTIEDQEITRPMILARLMSLQQIASGFVIQDGEPIYLDASHKWEPMADTLEEIGTGEPAVVWAHFRHEIDWLEGQIKRLGRKPVVAYGGLSQKELDRRVDSYMSGESDTIIAHPATVGAGNDFQRAQHALRFSRSYILEDFEQSDGRINRAHSQFDRTSHHEYITEDSRDEQVATALFAKQDLSRTITLDFVTADERHAHESPSPVVGGADAHNL